MATKKKSAKSAKKRGSVKRIKKSTKPKKKVASKSKKAAIKRSSKAKATAKKKSSLKKKSSTHKTAVKSKRSAPVKAKKTTTKPKAKAKAKPKVKATPTSGFSAKKAPDMNTGYQYPESSPQDISSQPKSGVTENVEIVMDTYIEEEPIWTENTSEEKDEFTDTDPHDEIPEEDETSSLDE